MYEIESFGNARWEHWNLRRAFTIQEFFIRDMGGGGGRGRRDERFEPTQLEYGGCPTRVTE